MKKLTKKEYLLLGSMLFGMFFGAGNLIFPVYMGQLSGANSIPAIIGFCMTGVGLPLLGIAAIGISKSEGLFDASKKVSTWFSYFFTVILYLSIGPLFAIPRTATVSFTTGITPFITAGQTQLGLFIYTLIFFALVLLFSLRPSKIMTWIGKYINSIFLVLLFCLLALSFIKPIGSFTSVQPTDGYISQPFFTGLLEGYNTMDALASLAFAIVLINAIKEFHIKDAKEIAKITLKSGVIAVVLMALIYFGLTILGAQSVLLQGASENGGVALAILAKHYYGAVGNVLLAGIMIFACLKTAIGLVTSCAETFVEVFPKTVSYRIYAIGFTLISFLLSNFGLDRILKYSLPALLFLYPITIVFVLLLLVGSFVGENKIIYQSTIIATIIGAFMDTFSKPSYTFMHSAFTDGVVNLYQKLPMYEIGFAWVIFSVIGLIIGFVLSKILKK
ncbi:branched-chain amino acid transport system II carrier protein [Solobacterium sp.]|uniref:branched-chain amino acid transport system II carrier protein n=1 Tax=Solobacterium sp. TaxID=2060878 RepID=UPI0025E9B1C1|nr:branched-chain amino acid transport system II carrier protein [Solobacterium sp.]